jgi:hypothetical protein
MTNILDRKELEAILRSNYRYVHLDHESWGLAGDAANVVERALIDSGVPIHGARPLIKR